ncbi:MAG TPA: protein kinase [Polyangiaceae bacterium]|jgi:serine/threonine-protein kinase|nr:protein kinase [Polyangiaceae bacterium]
MKRCPRCGLVFPDESTFCFLSGDTLQPAEDPLVGLSLDGRFRVESALGATSWSKVYLGRYRLLTEPCVIKVFATRLDAAGEVRFAEALVNARRCTHPNMLAPVGGGMTEDGHGFVVHERREGRPLAQLLGRGPLPPATVVSAVRQVLKALVRAHDFGTVHGDIRPSNVLVSSNGHAELMDIGLGRTLLRDAWEEDPGAFVAQQYLAPELSSQERASVAADLYAVGVTAFQMLTGTMPVEADDVRELRTALTEEHGASLSSSLASTPPPLAQWLTRVLDRNPKRRPANAHQALEELGEACREAGVVSGEDPGSHAAPPRIELDRSFARWARFADLFSKMVRIGFPGGPPDQTRNGLGMIQGRVEQLVDIGKKAVYQHGTLSDVQARARRGREEIAHKMEELNAVGQSVRNDIKPLRAAGEKHGERAIDYPVQVRTLHREVLRWEGRSAFAEPYRELAEAYRKLADLVDHWWEIRNAQLSCDVDAEAQQEKLRELKSQLEELRKALRVHESNLAAEIDACEGALRELGKHADQLEFELLDLASRFSAPLRSKPELGECFRELTQVA